MPRATRCDQSVRGHICPSGVGTLHTLPYLRNSYVPEGSAQIGFFASRNWLQVWSAAFVYMYHKVQFEFKLKHTGTRSAAAWPPHRLCYRPIIFFPNNRLTWLSYPQRKHSAHLKYAFPFFLLLNISQVLYCVNGKVTVLEDMVDINLLKSEISVEINIHVASP
jgi:hypothetical protein